MSEENHATIQVLRAQYMELCRRIEEMRTDVRAEQAETRQAMSDGFARIETCYTDLATRVRTVEVEQGQAKERLSTWRALIPLLSGLAAGVGTWLKDMIAIWTR